MERPSQFSQFRGACDGEIKDGLWLGADGHWVTVSYYNIDRKFLLEIFVCFYDIFDMIFPAGMDWYECMHLYQSIRAGNIMPKIEANKHDHHPRMMHDVCVYVYDMKIYMLGEQGFFSCSCRRTRGGHVGMFYFIRRIDI